MALKLELAQDMLLQAARTLGNETVRLEDAWHRVLAEPVVADTDFPPFDRSPLDGFAVIASEVEWATAEKPVHLTVVDDVPAGGMPREDIRPGTASRIMTGAPLPAGATGVIRLEDTVFRGDRVAVFAGMEAGRSVCRRAEEIEAGETVLQAGTVINAGAMGMLAVLGRAAISVYRRPTVALIATGSEIVPVEDQLSPGKIRNSNSYMLSAQVQDAGGRTVLLGAAPDDVSAISSLLGRCAGCDLVVTTGGASVGDYDLIGGVFRNLGIRLLFDRVSMKPGMPVLAGVRDGQIFIGLSGNPAAASVSFEQLVRPLLLKMGGRKMWWRPRVQAVLAEAFRKGTGARRFVWARCYQDGAGMVAEPMRDQGNGMLKSAISANALIIIPENTPPLPAGAAVEVILLADM